jgi:hypothetical protein
LLEHGSQFRHWVHDHDLLQLSSQAGRKKRPPL